MTCNVTLGEKWVFDPAWPTPAPLTPTTRSCRTGRRTISGRTRREAWCSAGKPPAHSDLLGPHGGQRQGTSQGHDSVDCLTGSLGHPPMRSRTVTPEDVHTLIPGARKLVTLYGKKAFTDVTLSWGEDPALSHWAQSHHQSPSEGSEGDSREKGDVTTEGDSKMLH